MQSPIVTALTLHGMIALWRKLSGDETRPDVCQKALALCSPYVGPDDAKEPHLGAPKEITSLLSGAVKGRAPWEA